MKQELPLSHRIYFSLLYTDLCRAVGYCGFSAREIAERLKPLAEQYGAKKLSLALFETMTFEGNRVMLNLKTRRLCGSLLGPPPERQLDFWSTVYEKDRPIGWDQVPEIPKGGPDPLMESLDRLIHADLVDRLQKARRMLKRSNQEDDRQEVMAIESELLRRGMDIPAPDAEEPEKAPKGKARERLKNHGPDPR